MMMASEAAARSTLVSVIAPTPRSMTRRLTPSPTSILASESSRASTEPETSPFRIRLSSWLAPFSIEDMKSSSVRRTRRLACTAAVEVRLDHQTLGVLVGVGPQVERGVRGEHDRLEELVEVQVRLGGHVDEHGVA